MPKPKTVELSDSVAARKQIIERAKNGDAAAMTSLRELLAQAPEVREAVTGMLEQAVERKTIKSIGSGSAVFQEGLRQRLADLSKELEGPSPSPVERLLANRIAMCWLQVQEADLAATGFSGCSLPQANFHSKRQDRAHRRFLSAIRSLAMIRKLALPAMQLNIAENQINVASAGVDD